MKNGDLINAYLRLKKQLKKSSLTQKDMNNYGEFSSSVYERRFGSWNEFLNHIGDNVNVRTNITKKDLIEDYFKIARLLNKEKLSAQDIRTRGGYSLSTYLNSF